MILTNNSKYSYNNIRNMHSVESQTYMLENIDHTHNKMIYTSEISTK